MKMGKKINKLARFVGNLKQEYRQGLKDEEENGDGEEDKTDSK